MVSALASTEQPLEYKKPDSEEIQFIRSALQSPGETFPLADFAFYRKSAHAGPAKRKNIVLIIMESWSAADVGACGARKSLTPAFDVLAKKGMLFKNAYAAGSRSIASLSAIVSSLPPLFGRSYITSAYEQNKQTGIADILRQRGYATIFAYAARSGSMGFDSYARLAGFETIITRDSFDANTPNDEVWGIYDHITLARLHSEISQVKKPFLATFFSLHPHSPYRLPEGYALTNYAEAYSPFEKAMLYSDYALDSFMQKARKFDWYNNTIFIITADHTFAKTDVREKFRIPLLIYTPDGSVKPGVSAKFVSQTDILPTVIDLLRIPVQYAAAGKTVFGKTGNLALSDNDSHMLLFAEPDFLQAAPGHEIQCNTLAVNSISCKKNSFYFKALYNALAHAYTENRIAP